MPIGVIEIMLTWDKLVVDLLCPLVALQYLIKDYDFLQVWFE